MRCCGPCSDATRPGSASALPGSTTGRCCRKWKKNPSAPRTPSSTTSGIRAPCRDSSRASRIWPPHGCARGSCWRAASGSRSGATISRPLRASAPWRRRPARRAPSAAWPPSSSAAGWPPMRARNFACWAWSSLSLPPHRSWHCSRKRAARDASMRRWTRRGRASAAGHCGAAAPSGSIGPMYLTFFGLNEKPFAITPDPRYLYLSERHAEALAHLLYGINEAGGFVQLTGEVGTGKTTIVRSLLAQTPKNAEIALILNPKMTAPEFLLTICEELGIGVPDSATESLKDLVDILSGYLLRAHAGGRRVVVVVDEAQNLAPTVLEQVRLLTNLETNTRKLLQIILIGQPELRELLGRNELRQLAQRITGRYHLNPLTHDETAAYVRHRLRVAGATSDIFSPPALAEVHRLGERGARVINVVCDRALLGAYSMDRHRVTSSLVRHAAGEVFGKRFSPRWLPWLGTAAAAAMLTITTILLWNFRPWSSGSHAVAATTAQVEPTKVATTAPP